YSMKSFFKTSFLSIFLFTHFSLYAQPPANDDCANAISITQLDGTCNNYSFQNATFDFTNGSCAPLSANNVWFSFVAQGTYANINLVGNPKLATGGLSLWLLIDQFRKRFTSRGDAARGWRRLPQLPRNAGRTETHSRDFACGLSRVCCHSIFYAEKLSGIQGLV
ncbi:MAG TPA: hypothetical protein PLI34_20100, partial [Saprospiraceae bacterium]|nr:hypothetical protein [Saprospiraceae bacterium]